MDAPRISAVEPLPGYLLRVTFANGVQKLYDCTPLLHRNAFRILKTEAFFKAVSVDTGGYGISWSDEADLSEYELWTKGEESSVEPSQSDLVNSPKFKSFLQAARQEIAKTGGIPHDEFWHQVDAEHEIPEASS